MLDIKKARRIPKGADLSHIQPDLRDKAVPITALSGHPDNPRKHPDANKQAIAGSLRKYLQRKPVVANVTEKGLRIEAGHGVYGEMLAAGAQYIAVTVVEDDAITELGYMLADNRTGDLSEDDPQKLAPVLRQLIDAGKEVEEIGWDEATVKGLLRDAKDERNGDESSHDDDNPQTNRADELQKEWQTARGQVWEIPSKSLPGQCHRVACGDSTKRDDVVRLMGGIKGIDLLHADPPYGMGKEADGVANDNLYREKLDAFQMAWWGTWRPFLADNASAYIWGNAPELWRLWYVGGLSNSERLTLRNEIVWDKGSNPGIASEDLRCYSPAGNERCLFFVIGEQGFNGNADNYWDGWEPVRSLLEADCLAMGWGPKDIKRICGVGMYSHWFTKSQWTLIPEEHYKKLQIAARDHDAFKRDHDAFKRDHDAFKRDHDELKRIFYSTRAYFDNTHDNMTDVWEFPRVTGEDRHGHATPKPVALVERVIKSSCPPNKVVAEPFLGSGTTLIAAERVSRVCVGMEISPAYVAVILQRAKDAGMQPRRLNV